MLFQKLRKQIEKIVENPVFGKPLRNVLRNYRRVHVDDSFVLVYEIYQYSIQLIDFDHHDNIYKK